MTIEEFNAYPDNLRLGILGALELKYKKEWLESYVLDSAARWESPEDMISQLIPTLL